jgi:hypothetical protein
MPALFYLMSHSLFMKHCMIWFWFVLVNLMIHSTWFQTPIINLLVTCKLRQSIKNIYLMITSYCWAYWLTIINIHYMILRFIRTSVFYSSASKFKTLLLLQFLPNKINFISRENKRRVWVGTGIMMRLFWRPIEVLQSIISTVNQNFPHG